MHYSHCLDYRINWKFKIRKKNVEFIIPYQSFFLYINILYVLKFLVIDKMAVKNYLSNRRKYI